jgi:large subunit ribosomal protein L14
MSRLGLTKLTRYHVADSSGAKIVQGWGMYNNKKLAKINDILKSSIKKAIPNSKVKKKSISKMRVVRTSYKFCAHKTYHVKFFQNAAILCDDNGNNISSNLSGAASNYLDKKLQSHFSGGVY